MSVFSRVGGAHNIKRTSFNLNFSKVYNCNFGQLIPVMCEECVPGDSFRLGNQVLVRFEPQLAPFLSDVFFTTDYFFCPTRLVDENWEQFITGGQLVSDTREGHEGEQVLEGDLVDIHRFAAGSSFGKYSLEDYLGFPCNVDLEGVIDYSRRVYNLIWNEYYRDQDLDAEVSLENNTILYRAWQKDYFTSALRFQQKGIAPSFSLSGTTFASFSPQDFDLTDKFALEGTRGAAVSFYNPVSSISVRPVLRHYFAECPYPDFNDVGSTTHNWFGGDSVLSTNTRGLTSMPFDVSFPDGVTPSVKNPVRYTTTDGGSNVFLDFDLNKNVVDLTNATVGFDVSDLRYAFQVQKFMERNARAGSRYTEWLRAQFGVSPRDDRLQLPEFIGRTTQKIVTSEVLQTGVGGEGQTGVGKQYGHSMSYGAGFAGRYFCQEFGYIIGISSVTVKAQYYQGVNRQWLRKNRYDFFNPLYVNLSEQGVYNGELFWQAKDGTTSTDDYGVFGFQGIFDEMRVKHDVVCADMRPSLYNRAEEEGDTDYAGFYNYWTLARKFDTLPTLSSDFIKGKITDPRIFAVTDADHPQIVVNFGNLILATRPLPYVAEPGLVDHH